VPEIEAGKDGETHGSGNGRTNGNGNGDKAVSEFHRAAADLLTKADMHAPAQSAGDAASASRSAPTPYRISASTRQPPPRPLRSAQRPPHPVPPQAQAQAPAVAVPLSGLAVEITAQAHAGRNHFEIRLDPPDLGRINVKLDVDSDGNVTTHLVVDRAEYARSAQARRIFARTRAAAGRLEDLRSQRSTFRCASTRSRSTKRPGKPARI
jgi:hypothetical protein